MTSFNPNHPKPSRGIMRDLFVLVLAEVLVMGLAWCLSQNGRATIARIFRSKRSGANTPTQSTIIDV